MHRRLLQEAGFTYTEAFDIALTTETTEKNVRCLEDYIGEKSYFQREEKIVNRVGKPPKHIKLRGQPPENSKCYQYGGNH